MPANDSTQIGAVLRDAFDAIYVINLPERTDRRAQMQRELARVGLDLGQDVQLFAAIRPVEASGWPTIGARGCFESHLGVLEDALEQGYSRVLVLEDDVSFAPALTDARAEALATLVSGDWACLYGGPVFQQTGDAPVLRQLAPDEALIGLHFFAMRASFMARARDMLEAMRHRPAGHPEGGPMHVDGAYNHVRRTHPDLVAMIAEPGLAYQRASRTDVHDLRWFDRLPGIAQGVALLRVLRNRQR